MNPKWTGGQYSLFRLIFGGYLFIHFAHLLPYGTELFSNQGMLPDAAASPLAFLFPNLLSVVDQPSVIVLVLVVAMAASVAFALGWRDRIAALLLWYLWACLFGRNPLIANPSLPFVGWMLLAHVFLPTAPFGSWQARNRPDPGGGWRMRGDLFTVAWILMAVAYSYSGWTKLTSPSWIDGSAVAEVLANPLARDTWLNQWFLQLPGPILQVMTWSALAAELLFAPLALSRRLRPWLWGALLIMHVSLIVVIDFADLSFGMVLLHLFTFDPGWLPARRTRGVIAYDGTCGLCHGWVRLVLAEDRLANFRFTPLQGEQGQALIADLQERRQDSLILKHDDGRVFQGGAAVIEILAGLGGLWTLLAIGLRGVPKGLLNFGYRTVARWRHRIQGPPENTVCPLIPAHLRPRFTF